MESFAGCRSQAPGLPHAAAPIVEARPASAIPIESGDVSIIRKKIKI